MRHRVKEGLASSDFPMVQRGGKKRGGGREGPTWYWINIFGRKLKSGVDRQGRICNRALVVRDSYEKKGLMAESTL